jgi:DNA polymerase
MTRIVVDWETFYGTKYSLRSQKINYTDYIRATKFAPMCLGVKIGNAKAFSLRPHEIEPWIRSVDWSTITLVAHNTLFDGLILAERYGIRPKRWCCTMAIARAMFQGSIGVGLDEVATALGLGGKKKDVLDGVKDKYFHELTPEKQEKLLDYCETDTELAASIHDVLAPMMPESELDLLHMTMRQFLEPVLVLDEPKLQAELNRRLEERRQLIINSGLLPLKETYTDEEIESARKTLASVKQFAELLQSKGVEVPTKWSNKTESEVPAFSRQDLAWVRTVQKWRDENRQDLVRLAEARINCASSMHISRPQRLLETGKDGQPIGAAYNYYAAHTGRWGGANKLNFQNFKRKGEIRKSIRAPKGR